MVQIRAAAEFHVWSLFVSTICRDADYKLPLMLLSLMPPQPWEQTNPREEEEEEEKEEEEEERNEMIRGYQKLALIICRENEWFDK
jgi:hypothetical protein